MPWRNDAAKRSSILLGLIAGAVILWGSVASAFTQINAVVCNGGTAPTLTVTSPVSDSTTNQVAVPITGSVSMVGQITISVDGNYNSTVAVPAGATTFQTSVQMNEGTHTLQLTGHSICSDPDIVQTLVLTVALPAANPSTPPITILPSNTTGVVITKEGYRGSLEGLQAANRDDTMTSADSLVIQTDDGYGFHPIFRDKIINQAQNPLVRQIVEVSWVVVFVSGVAVILFGQALFQFSALGTRFMLPRSVFILIGAIAMVIAVINSV